MKKTIIFTAVFTALSITSVSAQVKFGAGIVLGANSGIYEKFKDATNLGLNARANYALGEFTLSGGFTYFMPIKGEDDHLYEPGKLELKFSQLNFDVHYSLSKNDKLELYGLAGLNYTIFTLSSTSGYHSATLGNEIIDLPLNGSKSGFDLGIGANLKKFFGELKYDTALEQIALTVGMNF